MAPPELPQVIFEPVEKGGRPGASGNNHKLSCVQCSTKFVGSCTRSAPPPSPWGGFTKP